MISPPEKGEWFCEWDYNLFYSNLGRFKATVRFGRKPPMHSEEYTLDEWQNLGYDEHSKFADPLFVDPEHGDFRLRSGSPAFALGFNEFGMDHFGLTDDFCLARA